MQHDGRAAYATIAAAVGLSETAVRNRVKRLTDAGVMQIVAVTDPTQLGFARQAMIRVRTSGRLEPVAEALAERQSLGSCITEMMLPAGSVVQATSGP